MSSELDSLVQYGQDVTSFAYYGLAIFTVLFYDYLLTLEDEIEYFWRGRKTWTFWLFIANRYFPMTFLAWMVGIAYCPVTPQSTKVCERTAWFILFAWTICGLLARVAVTIRVYAVTLGNIPGVVGLVIAAVAEVVFGMTLTIHAVETGAKRSPLTSVNGYHLCQFYPQRPLMIACSGVSLCYDLVAFALIISSTAKLKTRGIKVSVLLSTIVEDSTLYFLFIFASQFVFMMTLILGRESIQLLPALGSLSFFPVMIGRLMLSLRKAADRPLGNWSLAELSANDRGVQSSIMFRRPRRSLHGGGDSILFDTVSGSQAATQ